MTNGMSVRFAKKYVLVADVNPNAYSAVMCPACCELFGGQGTSLKESMARADEKMAAHVCKGQRTDDGTV